MSASTPRPCTRTVSSRTTRSLGVVVLGVTQSKLGWPIGIWLGASVLSSVLFGLICPSILGQVRNEPHIITGGTWPDDPPIHWTPVEATVSYTGSVIHCNVYIGAPFGDPATTPIATSIQVGWPIQAFRSTQLVEEELTGQRIEMPSLSQVNLPKSAGLLLNATTHGMIQKRVVPLRPVWPAVAVMFAAHWAIIGGIGFTVLVGRRLFRKARSRCVGCGYPRLGTRCPECGRDFA
jgi:hypothetical protein